MIKVTTWLHSNGKFRLRGRQLFPVIALLSFLSMVFLVRQDELRHTFHRIFVSKPGNDDATQTWRYVVMNPIAFEDGRRLGNHLFNFAAMLHVAKLTGRRIATTLEHPHGWIDDVFDVDITRFENITLEICPCYSLANVSSMTYDKSLKNLSTDASIVGKSIILNGFTQSWMYTVGIESELRRYLRPHRNLSDLTDRYLSEIVPERWRQDPSVVLERVGIHIRVTARDHEAYAIPKLPFFSEAMEYVVRQAPDPNGMTDRRRIQFVVMSDDVEWCRKEINLSSVVERLVTQKLDIDLQYSIGRNASFDFVLLTKCDVTIITAGSYGWWGAWLTNRTTIYYRNYPKPGSDLAENRSKLDEYYPSYWIPIGGPWYPVVTNASLVSRSLELSNATTVST